MFGNYLTFHAPSIRGASSRTTFAIETRRELVILRIEPKRERETVLPISASDCHREVKVAACTGELICA